MQFGGIQAAVLLFMVLVLNGCGASNSIDLQNQWLAANFPDRAAHLSRLPASPSAEYFRDAVIAGQIQLGMSVDEVLIATDTAPYGPKPFKGKFWCGELTVSRCAADCVACDGVIFIKDRLIRFSGTAQPPTVIDLDSAYRRNSIFNAPSADFRIAQALYRNEIVKGMTIKDVNRVLSALSAQASYQCNDAPAEPVSGCGATCLNCTIEFHEAQSLSQGKTIFLQQQRGEYRVDRVQSTPLRREADC